MDVSEVPVHYFDPTEAKLRSSEQIRYAEKLILIKEIEDHTETKRQLEKYKEIVARLTSPVTQEEMPDHKDDWGVPFCYNYEVTELINNRLKED